MPGALKHRCQVLEKQGAWASLKEREDVGLTQEVKCKEVMLNRPQPGAPRTRHTIFNTVPFSSNNISL